MMEKIVSFCFRSFLPVLFLFLPAIASASLESEIGAIFASKKNLVEWSVQVQDAETGKTVYSLYPKRQLIPASNMKLVAGAAGLLVLGPDYTYKTNLYATGPVTNGVLEGDLIVVGSGDPSIGGHFSGGNITFLFDKWVEVLRQKNITRIQGNVVGVDDIFDDVCHGLNWNPVDFIEWYAAEVSGLSFNDGCVDIVTTGAAKINQAAAVTTDPPTSYVTLNANIRSVPAKQEKGLVFKREVDSNVIQITGSVAAKNLRRNYATISNPTQFFVTVFKESIEQAGIPVLGKALDADTLPNLSDANKWTLLDTYDSPPFQRILSKCLKDSQNLFAEHILKTVGAKESGVGSYETGVLAIKNIFFERGCNLDDQYVADGSGLSRENRMSAQAFACLLQVMHDSPYAEQFKEALAQTGVDGTLKSRMGGTPAAKRVYGKTGTMKGVSSLSGYVEAQSGRTYIFSIIGNSEKRAISFPQVQDDVCILLADRG